MHRVVVHGYFGARNLGDEAILDAIVRGLRQRVEQLHITVFSLDPYDTLPGRGREMCLEILARMRHKNDADVLLSRYRPNEILALTGHLDLAICTRLHAHIFAVRTGTPFVSIVYLAKVQRLLQLIQLENAGIKIRELDRESLVPRIDDVWSERDDLAKRLTTTGSDLCTGSQYTSDIAAKLIVGSR